MAAIAAAVIGRFNVEAQFIVTLTCLPDHFVRHSNYASGHSQRIAEKTKAISTQRPITRSRTAGWIPGKGGNRPKLLTTSKRWPSRFRSAQRRVRSHLRRRKDASANAASVNRAPLVGSGTRTTSILSNAIPSNGRSHGQLQLISLADELRNEAIHAAEICRSLIQKRVRGEFARLGRKPCDGHFPRDFQRPIFHRPAAPIRCPWRDRRSRQNLHSG